MRIPEYIRSFLLALGGALTGSILKIFNLYTYVLPIFLVSILFMALGVKLDKYILDKYYSYFRWRRNRIKIGIISIQGLEPKNAISWNSPNSIFKGEINELKNILSKELSNALRSRNNANENDTALDFNIIDITKENLSKFEIIINPYGGSYPEEDPINLSSLNKILEYIENGGIFVNISDVPFFWQVNPKTKTWAINYNGIQFQRPLIQPFAYEYFIIKKLNFLVAHPLNPIRSFNVNNIQIPPDIARPILFDDSLIQTGIVKDCISDVTVRSTDKLPDYLGRYMKYSFMIRLRLGKGEFLISTPPLDRDPIKKYFFEKIVICLGEMIKERHKNFKK
ncbi:Beta-galactosidase/Glycosyltransferase [Saccharolobus shibatae B12]|uniref:Beta-galactosidase/Glycosyltransferase n=1 Tax=Saccharolobus shibatae (strain ATCC 51178 / DSM 5389 / JCM 8931 / NBRC 15437 / B12) TaxID=523848 RepID=A0A8F5BKV6_SACSH|nr:hypothetical protein [Saccharolobus shibatae]QXJ27147.1 Beta-galactosidase/Glycosyltransferase [Saccharolobus shibatae B12]QXJ30040.1 Beta-galactosidase/Glycosyltransferase [Saccharolobus shibatae B12]